MERFTIHDEGYLVFRSRDGRLHGMRDRCPHRAARLTDGRIDGDTIECLYHGWRFAEDGSCQAVPQHPKDRSIPSSWCVDRITVVAKQGIVWAFLGEPWGVDESTIPILQDFDPSGMHRVDFAMDLPYEQTFLVENVIDVAHIHFAHHGIRGGGHRALGAPIEFHLTDAGAAGFEASFRSIGVQGSPLLKGAHVAFRSPNLVHYEPIYLDPEKCSGLALYSLPTGREACRLLYRSYTNFPRFRDRRRPRWFEHWTQATIIEQDMSLVIGQSRELTTPGCSPREVWHPVRTSDRLVLAYRKWLDRWAEDWPYAVKFSNVDSTREGARHRPPIDRHRMHTRICSSCTRMLRSVRNLGHLLRAIAFFMLGFAALATDPWNSAAFLSFAILSALGQFGTKLVARHFT